jgi:hypothetical protein
VRDELLNEFVHRLARFDEHHHAARRLEFGNHLFDGMRTLHFGAFGFVREERVHFFSGSIVSHDSEAVIVHVEDEVLAHDGQTNECYVAGWLHDFYLGDMKIRLVRGTIQNPPAPARRIYTNQPADPLHELECFPASRILLP